MNDAPVGWACHVHIFDANAPALPGHYQPPTRTLAMLDAACAAVGVGHYVLVQPSVYGTDNSLLLDGLRSGAGRHRGVAVIDPSITERELDTLHTRGVRGVRFNLVSPVGNGARHFAALAPRLQERGWHVQWHHHPADLPRIAALHQPYTLAAVLDHVAGITPGDAANTEVWAQLRRLADGGAWIKLSGWYRLQSAPPHEDMHGVIQRVVGLFGDRVVWGSDWPHTLFLEGAAEQAVPEYRTQWQPVAAALEPALAMKVLQDSPVRLYK
jgi:predicted TIM-barrel fold metal-dependent hydrolase